MDSVSKVLFIVGSSSGIGLSITKQFLNSGYRVAATTRSKETLIKAVGGQHDSTVFLPLENDLTNDEAIRNTIEQVIKHFGRIDVVIFNAGYGIFGTVEEINDQELRDMFSINFFACASVLRHVTKHLTAGSYVFTVSSALSVAPFPIIGAYGSTKAAMDGLVVSYAQEVESLGIRCTTINLGTFESSFGQVAKSTKTDLKQKYGKNYQGLMEYLKTVVKKDPSKISDILFQAINNTNQKDHHLFIGNDAIELGHQSLQQLDKSITNNESLTNVQ